MQPAWLLCVPCAPLGDGSLVSAHHAPPTTTPDDSKGSTTMEVAVPSLAASAPSSLAPKLPDAGVDGVGDGVTVLGVPEQ